MELNEIWKDISGFEGVYQVSNLGRVKSLSRCIDYTDGRIRKFSSQIIKPFSDKDGYQLVRLYKNSNVKTLRVHRLAYEAFFNLIDNMQINHKNGITGDNHIDNLELVTSSENHLHGFRELGRKPNICIGESNGSHKLTKVEVNEIRLKYIPRIYSSIKLAKEYGVNKSTILRIINSVTWKYDYE